MPLVRGSPRPERVVECRTILTYLRKEPGRMVPLERGRAEAERIRTVLEDAYGPC